MNISISFSKALGWTLTLLCFFFAHPENSFSQSKSYELTFGDFEDDFGTSIQLIDSIVYVLGTTRSFDAPEGDFFITAIDQNRNQMWSKRLGTNRRNIGIELASDKDILYLLSQTVEQNSSNSNLVDDVSIIALDTGGEYQWKADIGITNQRDDEHTGSITRDSEGNIILSAFNLRPNNVVRNGYTRSEVI
ncbi:MAG: hypothetical protein WA960_18375 [Tunicatimonas sp.]